MKNKPRSGTKKVRYQDTEFYFDNCPVCQAMKLAHESGREPTFTELQHAMLQAKKQGEIVGGELLEDDAN